jgi:hypothetical protein
LDSKPPPNACDERQPAIGLANPGQSASRVISGTIDFHIDEFQTKFPRVSSTSEFSRTFAGASVPLPRVAEHSSVMGVVLVSSYIKK